MFLVWQALDLQPGGAPSVRKSEKVFSEATFRLVLGVASAFASLPLSSRIVAARTKRPLTRLCPISRSLGRWTANLYLTPKD
jgi:hypothetical protein